MKTSKDLKYLVPDILTYIQKNQESHIVYNKKLLDIFEGQLDRYVDEALYIELGPKSYQRAKFRSNPINIIQQIIGKKAGVYCEPASRSMLVDNKKDQILTSTIQDEMKFDEKMSHLEAMLCLHKYVATEPYLIEGKRGKRVIDATEFLPFSDSLINPNEMTVFIKFMGTKEKQVLQEYDTNGNKLQHPLNYVKNVAVYRLYSEDEYLEIDSDGEQTAGTEVESSYIRHNNGYFDQTYIREGEKLLPTPDSGLFKLAIIIPLLITDINYYIQFCCHSTIYGLNLEMPGDLDFAPDVIWNLKTDGDEGSNSQIGTIETNTDTDKIWDSIMNQLNMAMEAMGLQSSTAGKVSGQNAESGIAKVMDSADVTRVRKKLKNKLSQAESDIWALIATKQKAWVANGEIEDRSAYSKDAKVMVSFAEEKPFHDFAATLTNEKGLQEIGLTTPELSLARLFPDLTEEQRTEMLKKIEEHKAQAKEDFLDGIPAPKEEGNEDENEDEIPPKEDDKEDDK